MSQEVFYRPWSELVSQLPPDARPAREKMLLEEVRAGNYVPIEWSSVTSILNGMVLTFKVASDALRVGSPDDCVRINVTAQGTQELNDILGVTWQTTKSADLIHQQADIRISPCTQTPDARMAFTDRMVQHSKAVDAKIAGRTGLVSTVGKDWVLTPELEKHPGKAANFGWHTTASKYRSPGGIPVLQPMGFAHNQLHVDYSQVYRPLHPVMTLDGKERFVEEILSYPEFAPLLSYEGAIKSLRLGGDK